MLASLGLAADLNLINGLPAETGAAHMLGVVIYLESVSFVFDLVFTGTISCCDLFLQCLDGRTVLKPHRWQQTFPMFYPTPQDYYNRSLTPRVNLSIIIHNRFDGSNYHHDCNEYDFDRHGHNDVNL